MQESISGSNLISRTTLNSVNTIESKKNNGKYTWMSTRLSNVTLGREYIDFSNAEVLAVLELDLEKCRIGRLQSQQFDFGKYGYNRLIDVCYPSFLQLIQEKDLQFDKQKYPLLEAFIKMLGNNLNVTDLANTHERYCQDKGQLKDRDEKRNLLQNVLIREKRMIFQHVFINFVLNYIAPHVQSITNCKKLYFQAFPCIRVVRPGEFSIGPHCDAAYGFSQANINFYIPLTKIYGTNSLILESYPGKEDWHTIEGEYGCIKRFYGAQCSHFTAENATNQTRVSLDFRVIEDQYWVLNHDQFTSTPGYYTSCSYVENPCHNNGEYPGAYNLNSVVDITPPDTRQHHESVDSDIMLKYDDNIPNTMNSLINKDFIDIHEIEEVVPIGTISDDSTSFIHGQNEVEDDEIMSTYSKGHWRLDHEIVDPDWRNGFPFEKKSINSKKVI